MRKVSVSLSKPSRIEFIYLLLTVKHQIAKKLQGERKENLAAQYPAECKAQRNCYVPATSSFRQRSPFRLL